MSLQMNTSPIKKTVQVYLTEIRFACNTCWFLPGALHAVRS